MIKVELLFGVVVFAVWVFTLVDVVGTPNAVVRTLPKPAWVVGVLLFPLLGSLAWFVLGRPEARPAASGGAPDFPEYDRPGRAAAADPAADEAFLRQVRARAEEQRRRAAEQRRRDEA